MMSVIGIKVKDIQGPDAGRCGCGVHPVVDEVSCRFGRDEASSDSRASATELADEKGSVLKHLPSYDVIPWPDQFS